MRVVVALPCADGVVNGHSSLVGGNAAITDDAQ